MEINTSWAVTGKHDSFDPTGSFMGVEPNTPRPGQTRIDFPMPLGSPMPHYPSSSVSTPVRQLHLLNDASMETGPVFSPTEQHLPLWTMDHTQALRTQLRVRMDRGFFRGDQDIWTCYRRNYFQVSAAFDVYGVQGMPAPADVPCVIHEQGPDGDRFHQVQSFSIAIRANIAGSPENGKRIDLVQHTAKRDKGPQLTPKPRPVGPGGHFHLGQTSGARSLTSTSSSSDSHSPSVAVFERLQFKTATANNGKRRAAQQFFVVAIDLLANTTSMQTLCVATSASETLIVRGRSPGHYADTVGRRHHRVHSANSNNSNNSNNTSRLMSPTSPSIDFRFDEHEKSHHRMGLPNAPGTPTGFVPSSPPPPPLGYNSTSMMYSPMVPSVYSPTTPTSSSSFSRHPPDSASSRAPVHNVSLPWQHPPQQPMSFTYYSDQRSHYNHPAIQRDHLKNPW